MKKTATILSALILVMFTGTFLVSYGLKKASDLRAAKTSTSTSLTDPKAAKSDKVVFYETVGASPKAAENPSTRQITRFTIEVANFNDQSEAEALLLKLKSRGIEGFYTPVRRGGEVIYRVRLGMFANPDDAQKVLAKVNTVAKVNGTVSKLQ